MCFNVLLVWLSISKLFGKHIYTLLMRRSQLTWLCLTLCRRRASFMLLETSWLNEKQESSSEQDGWRHQEALQLIRLP